MKKYFFLLLFIALSCFPFASRLFAADFYITQSGSGGGTSCSDPYSAAWFNTSGNWANPKVAGKVGPGDTVHLCNAISTALTAQNSGSSGSPVTIHFEIGASLSQPYCPGTGCMVMNNLSYIVVDGGNNGIVQSTANGTALANQGISAGITATSCNNCEIKNLTIQNIYVHIKNSGDNGLSQTQLRGIYFSGSNVSIHNNVLHDTGWAITDAYNNGNSNVNIFNNEIYNSDHGVVVASGGNVTASGIYVYGNYFHDYSNWDDTGCPYHHDGIHAYGTGSGGVWPQLNDLQIYNNKFTGVTGGCLTSHIFLEGGPQSGAYTPWTGSGEAFIFNNLLVTDIADLNGIVYVGAGVGDVFNNTIIGPTAGSGVCLAMWSLQLSSGSVVRNNFISGCNILVGILGAAFNNLSTDLDYNVYANCPTPTSYNCWTVNGTQTSNWNTYQSAQASDSHSVNATSSLTGGLNQNGLPQSSSPVIQAGTNLTSLGITALDSDILGIPRPASAAWDGGAYQYASPATYLPWRIGP